MSDDYHAGTGNWRAFNKELDQVYAAASQWKTQISGVDRPWLCWNINDAWCVLQQKIILSVGWTPVVGWDPSCNAGNRTILKNSIEIDFNREFGFASIWPHFPLEFAFLWTERLAFWHADLLVRMSKLNAIVDLFERMKDGEIAAVVAKGGLRNSLRFRTHRYWELLGCTTRQASKHQFDTGCGWWRQFYLHPNSPIEEKRTREKYYYDSGVGIMYWRRRYKRDVIEIKESLISEGHFTQINNPSYRTAGNKGAELDANFSLQNAASKLGLLEILNS